MHFKWYYEKMQVICHELSLGLSNLILFVTLKLPKFVWRQVCTKSINKLRVWRKVICENFLNSYIGIGGEVINVAPGVSVEFTCTGKDGEFQPTWIVNRRVAVTEGDCYTSRLIRAQNPQNVTATLTINGNHDTCRTFNVYCRLYRESQFIFVHNTTLVV